LDSSVFEKNGVHLHVHAGAIPKDGPSAGVTMVSALASIYTNRPLRSDTAMTSEITLTGLVLPIGGLKEKVLAARRAGIRRIVLPKHNLQDLDELQPEVRQDLEFIPIETIDEALQVVFEDQVEEPAAERLPQKARKRVHRQPLAAQPKMSRNGQLRRRAAR